MSITLATFQPEFTTQIWDYLDSRVNPYTVRIGREHYTVAGIANSCRCIEVVLQSYELPLAADDAHVGRDAKDAVAALGHGPTGQRQVALTGRSS